MSPKKLKGLKQLNQALSNNSWRNFLEVLRVIDSTTNTPGLSDVIQSFESGHVEAGYELADSLAKQPYTSAMQHFVASQLSALIKKYPYTKDQTSFDPRREAWEKFATSEQKCQEVNDRFRVGENLPTFLLEKMRQFISYTIGEEPNLSEIWSKCDFGPGANIGVHGNATHLARKIEEKWSVTPSAFLYARSAVSCNHQLFEVLYPAKNGVIVYDHEAAFVQFRKSTVIVDYNKISFVPKTAKTDRSIAVEPLLNSFLQKGTDNVMRHRLKRIGIDLGDQSKNSEAARKGSISEHGVDAFATIDLKSASDSISIELCRYLLPPAWFEFLDSIRSKRYKLDDGSVKEYAKFCSMGNGFCFPLETLIFTAACKAVGAGTPGIDFLVYGDDIAVNVTVAQQLLDLLRCIGFDENPEKTFITGPFRESCGMDWFEGADVRPFTLDFALDSVQNVIKFCNLTQRSYRTSMYFGEAVKFVKNLLPDNFRFVRPHKGNSETAITVELDEFMSSPHAKWSKRLQCWSWHELRTMPVPCKKWHKYERRSNALVIAALRGASSNRPFTLRRTSRTRVERVVYSSDPNNIWDLRRLG